MLATMGGFKERWMRIMDGWMDGWMVVVVVDVV
jgi:hypothetical protein